MKEQKDINKQKEAEESCENIDSADFDETQRKHGEKCACHKHEHEHEHEHEHGHCRGHHHDHDEEGCCCGHDHDHDEEGGCCGHDHDHEHGEETFGFAQILSYIIGAALVALSFLGELTAFPNWLGITCAALVYVWFGKEVYEGALENIKRGKIFTEFTLMCVATIGAAILGEFADAAAVMLLYSLGEKVSEGAYAKSKKNITDLMEITEEKVALGKDGSQIVKASEVQVGDIFLVRVGEKISLDGVVVEGQGYADTAAITGESAPAELHCGSDCLSGCTLISGTLVICAARPYGESTENRMKKAVKEAAKRKAKTEKRITKFASVFTPLAFAATAVTVLVCKFGFDMPWQDAVRRGLVILVSSCPCSLVLSIPLTYFSGLGYAAGRGVVFRGGETVDNAAKLRTVVFDKTGTLTSARLDFEGIEIFDRCLYKKDYLMDLCYCALSKSPHAAAKSFCASYQPGRRYPVTDAENIGGKGLVCVADGKKAMFGNAQLMADCGITVGSVPQTCIYAAIDGVLCGVLLFGCGEKQNAASEIARLRRLGVDRMAILSGDNPASVAKTASNVGIEEFFAELKPDEKYAEMEHIYKEEKSKNPGGAVAFCGDGLNDSAVIAGADVGIAMGSGSALTVDTADAVIVDDNLARIGDMICIAKKIVRIANQNIMISLGIKFAVILLGLFWFQSLELAVVADVGAAVITVLNAIRAGKGDE